MNHYLTDFLNNPTLPNSMYPGNTILPNSMMYPNNQNGAFTNQQYFYNNNYTTTFQNNANYENPTYNLSNRYWDTRDINSYWQTNNERGPNSEMGPNSERGPNENTIRELDYLNLNPDGVSFCGHNDKTKDYKIGNDNIIQDNENYYDSFKEINIEEYNNYKIIKNICNLNVNNYLKTHHTQRFDKVCSTMMTSIHTTNVDVLTDIFIKVNFTNLNIYESNLYLIVRIENMTIIKIPYLFLKQWLIYENKNEYEFSEFIRIPLEILSGDIHLHLLSKSVHKTIMVEIHYFKYEMYPNSISEFISNGECVFVGKYMNSQTKKLYQKDDSAHYPTQFFQSMYIKECNRYNLTLPCKFKKSTKGFILIGEEVSEITNLCIRINSNILLQYDKDKIGILCERITSRMLYVPLDYKYKIKSTSTDSYNSVIYFSDDYDVSISIESPPQNYLILMALTLSSYQIVNKKIVIDQELIDSNKIYKYIIEKGVFRGNKLVDAQKSFCVISQENIKAGENYTECETCKNSFINKHIHTYFEFNDTTTTRICPYCRNEWNSDIFYCNKSREDNPFIYMNENVSYLEEL